MIEIDGGQHGIHELAEDDLVRTQWLESQGFKVLRFWNDDGSRNLDGVLETVLMEVSR